MYLRTVRHQTIKSIGLMVDVYVYRHSPNGHATPLLKSHGNVIGENLLSFTIYYRTCSNNFLTEKIYYYALLDLGFQQGINAKQKRFQSQEQKTLVVHLIHVN